MTANLIALAAAAEAATEAEQANLLNDAWDALGPILRWTAEQAGRFGRLMDAEAYESAALMFAPPPDKWSLTAARGRHWEAASWEDGEGLDWRDGATPALALLAAFLRARITAR